MPALLLAAHPGAGRAAAATVPSVRGQASQQLIKPVPCAARPRCRRLLSSRCQAGGAAQADSTKGDGLKARIAANFDQLFVTVEGKQYISVEKLLEVCAAHGEGRKEELAAALQQAVAYATELRQQGSAPTLAGKPSKEVVGQLVRQVEEKHQKHRMDLEEMLNYASHELEPQAGPSPALQLAMRQLRDRIGDKLEKHVNAEREIDDLRKLVDASEEAQG